MSTRITAIRIAGNRIVLDSPEPVVPVEMELEDESAVVVELVPPAVTANAEEATAALLPQVLVLGQKVPSKSEVAVCGAIAKRIRRTDPEFATLVRNTNAAIVFKDEEGNGDDRMMTPRLKEKLDVLATKVSAEWSGTKLRVTEAWDGQGEHSAGSLHYEGRGADLTTAPLDPAKLGRLGQLAVDAGFDWVFFENAAHVHASVKK